MKTITLKYISKKLTARTLLFLFMQQSVAAFGTYALIKAGLHINSKPTLFFWIAVSLFCHVISPFFAMVIKPLEYTLGVDAFKNYVADKLFSRMGRPGFWQQKHQRESFLASIGGETDSYLSAIIYVGLDIFSYTISILLNVLILGISLDKAFIPAFLTSGVLSYLCYNKMKSKVEAAFYQEQQARTSVFSYLLNSWDNVLLKNKKINAHYEDQFQKRIQNTKNTSIKSSLWYEGMVSGLSLVSALPVAVVIIYLASQQQTSTTLIALLATIPRQLGMLTTFKGVFQAATSFLAFEAKFKAFDKNTQIEEVDLRTRIQHQKIKLDSKDYDSLVKIKNTVEESSQGRLEIRGPNGSGKSTLLLHLNDTLESSIYLPANPSFDIPDRGSDSTGNNLLRHIEHIANMDVSHILLDEWDANLDQVNIQKINTLLNSISKSKVIVEVRHR